jgi:hypothetical protein
MPDYGSGGTVNYIPIRFAKKTLVEYYKKAIIPQITNTDYEGEITAGGDTVRIRTIPDVAVSAYQKGQKLNYEDLSSPSVDLVIDKAINYAFRTDAVDEKQWDILMSPKFVSQAAYAMEQEVDSMVFASASATAGTGNYGATAGKDSGAYNLGASGAPVAISKANILDFIVDMESVLDEQDVPDDDESRYLCLPVWMCGMINKSDLKNASFSGKSESIITTKNRYLGDIAGFKLYKTNLQPTTADSSSVTAYNLMFGHKDAITFATQMVQNASLKGESQMGTLYRGLRVFGHKTVKPEALGWAYVYKA